MKKSETGSNEEGEAKWLKSRESLVFKRCPFYPQK
ncbi:unnamed protein product [Arabidopsis halleri]